MNASHSFSNIFFTLVIGLCGGVIASYLHAPMPWLMGSFLAVGALAMLPRVKLSMPSSWRNVALVGIGIQLGSGFNIATFSQMSGWGLSLATMLVLTVLFFLISYLFFRFGSDMSPNTAFMASVPGGVSIVSAICEDYQADVRRVALSHTVRLIVLLLMTPLLLRSVAPGEHYPSGLKGLGLIPDGNILDYLAISVVAVLGYLLARRWKIPAGALMLPMAFTALLYLTGLVQSHPPKVVVIVAQTIIGCSIGARFNGYRFKEILHDGWIAVLVGLTLGGMSFGGALLISRITGENITPVLLAFLPGGAPELGAVAVALHADPAFVAGHHFTRLLLILAAVPLLARYWLLIHTSEKSPV